MISDSLALAKRAALAMDAKKALDLKIIGIRDISILADYFVLATGTSGTQVKALADEVEYQLDQEGIKASHVEGYRSNSWILLDYGSVVIHIFTEESRTFYDLDRLWVDGKEESMDFLEHANED
ncbi:MAG TPA: ribosome silencing factor [Candidatus Gallacutalibacter pullicola]|uniref:Ribosomal silencing factor RsfS n=1 Tax=Candidatus Gallacutalibacter pullicola TaxID=2840830 RepID=A0A9D1DRB5_9FIRM|nr:ribosome silencing factor [Candidatus Gallacutalibacter pullicola]